MPGPLLDTVAAELYAANSNLAHDDEANGWALAHVCIAIGLMWQGVADIVEDRDGHPGWSAIVDVDRAPMSGLAWLAQRIGVGLTVGAPEAVQRDEIRRRSGEATGRPASMVAKAQTTLTGTKTVRLIERSSSAWTLTAITRTSETPDPAATLKALMSEKPAGLVLDLVVSDAPIVAEFTLTVDGLTEAIDDFTLGGVT